MQMKSPAARSLFNFCGQFGSRASLIFCHQKQAANEVSLQLYLWLSTRG
jgi:hypothetical protein